MSIRNNEWNHAGILFSRCCSVLLIVASSLVGITCTNVFAQQKPYQQTIRPVPNRATAATQTTNQVVPPSRVAVKPEMMKPAPDFWAIYSSNLPSLVATDRLDRKNLQMLYHFSYDQPNRSGVIDLPSISMAPVPGVSMVPTPPHQNNSHDYIGTDTRLRELREKVEADNRIILRAIPSPNDSTSQPGIPIRRLTSGPGVAALDDF